MRAYNDTILNSNTGRPLIGAQMRVLRQSQFGPGATLELATIYADANMTPADNPLTVEGGSSASPGFGQFYADDGFYTIEYLYNGQPIRTVRDVDISADVSHAEIEDVTGATLIGTSSGDTVQEELDGLSSGLAERPTSVALAATAGAASIGKSGGGTIQDFINETNGILDGTTVSRTAGASFASDLDDYRPTYRGLVLQREGDAYQIHRKCGPDVWERVQMRTVIPGNPLRVGEIWALKSAAYALPYVGSDVTLTGTWGANRSAGPDLYVGGVEAWSPTATRTAEATVTFNSPGGMIGAVFRKNADCGLVRVTINGGTELINLAPEVGGNVDLDLYAATSTPKVHIPLASSLPAGTYTIELEVLGANNPPSSGNRVNLNGFYFVGDGVSDPLLPATHAPLWADGATVVTNEHRYWLGNEYSTAAGGTTGSTPPTHTTGTASDGSIDWLWIRSSYGGDAQMIRQDTSEAEYAGALASGAEWGGDVHGNETLDDLEIVADGVVVSPVHGDVIRCSQVSFKQEITATDAMDGNAPMFSIAMRHDFTADGCTCSYPHTPLKAVEIANFLQWMHTVYHYDQLSRRFLFDYVHTPRKGRYRIADSYGNAAVQFGLEASRELRATGTGFKAVGTSGNPTKTGGTHRLIFTLRTSDEGMGFYENTTAGAYVQVNPSGKAEPDGGSPSGDNSGFFTKLYFASVRNNTLSLGIGDTLVGGGSWTLSAVQN